jgi:AcrR family transcriptional regulator
MPTATSSRAAILDAAQARFALRGFDGTTIKEIAADAGVNSALLYYYFRDKERLYQAVLDRLVQDMVNRAVKRLEASGSPEARLRGFLELQGELFGAHPHFYPLILRELVDHAAAHAVRQIKLVAATMFRRLCEVIEEGQQSGVFRADLDPRFAAISSVAVVLHFFTARPAIGLFLGHSVKGPPPDVVRAYVRHAVEFALAALTAAADTPVQVRRQGAAR